MLILALVAAVVGITALTSFYFRAYRKGKRTAKEVVVAGIGVALFIFVFELLAFYLLPVPFSKTNGFLFSVGLGAFLINFIVYHRDVGKKFGQPAEYFIMGALGALLSLGIYGLLHLLKFIS